MNITPANFYLLSILADSAVKGIIVLALAALVVLAQRKASAAVRHLTWAGALAGVLLLPVLSWLLPAWQIPGLHDWRPVPVVAPQVVLSVPAPTLVLPPAVAPQMEAPSMEVQVQPSVQVVFAQQPPARPQWGKLFLGSVGWLWLAGSGLTLLPLLIGWWQVARLTERCQPVADGEWKALMANAAGDLRLQRPVRLRFGAGVALPMTWGAWRPVLLLPEAARDWPEDRRRMVLLHELAHVQRWDWLTQTVAYFACALYWYNPLAWLAVRRMRLEREQACDDLVLQRDTRASDYAQELLQLAAAFVGRSLIDWATVPMARRSALEGRLRAILDPKRNRKSLTRAIACTAVVLAAIVVIPMAMLRGQAEPTPAAVAANMRRLNELSIRAKAYKAYIDLQKQLADYQAVLGDSTTLDLRTQKDHVEWAAGGPPPDPAGIISPTVDNLIVRSGGGFGIVGVNLHLSQAQNLGSSNGTAKRDSIEVTTANTPGNSGNITVTADAIQNNGAGLMTGLGNVAITAPSFSLRMDKVTMDLEKGLITASGNVQIFVNASSLRISANAMTLDEGLGQITASGNFAISSSGYTLHADEATASQAANQVTATGNVVLDAFGEEFHADKVSLDVIAGRMMAAGNVSVAAPGIATLHAGEVTVNDISISKGPSTQRTSNERHVTVFGLVNSPGPIDIPPERAMTLVAAIAQAHGPTERASKLVTITRKMPDGTTKSFHDVDLLAAMKGTGPDFPLQDGDVITVGESAVNGEFFK